MTTTVTVPAMQSLTTFYARGADAGTFTITASATGLTSAFGAKLSNPQIGIQDAPTNINLQGWRDSDSSQQQATQDLYEQGLAVDFGDIFKRAENAAPRGVSTGRKRYGL